MRVRPVAGLTRVQVEMPPYEGLKRFSKRAFDPLASGALIVLLSPSPGGDLHGRAALHAKSRVVAARARGLERPAVRYAQAPLHGGGCRRVPEAPRNPGAFRGQHGNVRDEEQPGRDPIGGSLRRFSVDELPRFVNVYGGTMSLVGPCPPLQHEVAVYENHVRRQFLVKPGITGLWKVSGRSNLGGYCSVWPVLRGEVVDDRGHLDSLADY